MADIEFRVADEMLPAVQRQLVGTTALDREIDGQMLPEGSPARRLGVRLIRRYRSWSARRLAGRCVFDPSCSRYGEQAVRHLGVVRGTATTTVRVLRCRPGRGGTDLPDAWRPPCPANDEEK